MNAPNGMMCMNVDAGGIPIIAAGHFEINDLASFPAEIVLFGSIRADFVICEL